MAMDYLALAAIVLGGFILMCVLVVGYLIYRKLRQHEETIDQLENNIQKIQDEQRTSDTTNQEDHVSLKDQQRMFDTTKNQQDHVSLKDELGAFETTKQSGPISRNASERSNKTNVNLGMTIRVNRETATVFGHVPLLSQTMMVAQEHYKGTDKTTNAIALEDVKLSDLGTGEIDDSFIFSDNWKKGEPTSVLFNGGGETSEDFVSNNKGMFVHKTIGSTGGDLGISGVQLNIPAGALKTPTLISVGILWDPKYRPNLKKRQALLSPIVLCQASRDIHFKKAVQLTIPHAAHNVLTDWNVTVLTRNGLLKDKSVWKETTDRDCQKTYILNNSIHVFLSHFTLYTCIGESKPGKIAAKVVNLVAFSRKETLGSLYKPDIYCVNGYKDDLSTVRHEVTEKSMSPEILEDTKLFIKDNDKDIGVELSKCSEGWSLVGDTKEFLPFELVWHACHPHCTFMLKPSTPNQQEIFSEFLVYQIGAENKFSKLKIGERITKIQQNNEGEHDTLIEELAVLLDPVIDVNSDAGDWRELAEHMGIPTARIRWLQLKSSPTTILLQEWFREDKTLADLAEMMTKIGRPDAVTEIENYMSSKGVSCQLLTREGHMNSRNDVSRL